MAKSYYETAKSAVQHAIDRHRLRLPTDQPILRIAFDHVPDWTLLSLVEAFDHDAVFVFGQPLNITDAYYGCFEADFAPSDRSEGGLDAIARKVMRASEFDDLIVKYRIMSVCLFNFPGLSSRELRVNYATPDAGGLNA